MAEWILIIMGATKAVKERLRKMREKFGLGEYRNSKPKTTKTKTSKKRRRVNMGKKRGFSRKSKMGGAGSLIKSALIGLGSAHVAGYLPLSVPMKEEVAGAAGAYLMNKNPMSALVGAGAVYLTKRVSANTTLESAQGIVLN
jgi:hypothetical protein